MNKITRQVSDYKFFVKLFDLKFFALHNIYQTFTNN